MQDIYAHIEDHLDESIAMLMDLRPATKHLGTGHRVRQGPGAGQTDV